MPGLAQLERLCLVSHTAGVETDVPTHLYLLLPSMAESSAQGAAASATGLARTDHVVHLPVLGSHIQDDTQHLWVAYQGSARGDPTMHHIVVRGKESHVDVRFTKTKKGGLAPGAAFGTVHVALDQDGRLCRPLHYAAPATTQVSAVQTALPEACSIVRGQVPLAPSNSPLGRGNTAANARLAQQKNTKTMVGLFAQHREAHAAQAQAAAKAAPEKVEKDTHIKAAALKTRLDKERAEATMATQRTLRQAWTELEATHARWLPLQQDQGGILSAASHLGLADFHELFTFAKGKLPNKQTLEEQRAIANFNAGNALHQQFDKEMTASEESTSQSDASQALQTLLKRTKKEDWPSDLASHFAALLQVTSVDIEDMQNYVTVAQYLAGRASRRD